RIMYLTYRACRCHGAPHYAAITGIGVLVSGLTTIVGFVSLMIADHRGIFGLGLLLTLGSATSLVAALVVLPVLLRLLHRAPAAPPTWRYEAPAPPPIAAVQRGDDR